MEFFEVFFGHDGSPFFVGGFLFIFYFILFIYFFFFFFFFASRFATTFGAFPSAQISGGPEQSFRGHLLSDKQVVPQRSFEDRGGSH